MKDNHMQAHNTQNRNTSDTQTHTHTQKTQITQKETTLKHTNTEKHDTQTPPSPQTKRYIKPGEGRGGGRDAGRG